MSGKWLSDGEDADGSTPRRVAVAVGHLGGWSGERTMGRAEWVLLTSLDAVFIRLNKVKV